MSRRSARLAELTKPPKPTKPTKHAKTLKLPRQTPEVIATIYYFGVFGVRNYEISKLILWKYPRALDVHAGNCSDRFVWFRDVYLPGRGLLLTKTIVGKEVKDIVPLIETVDFITEIDEECEKILEKASFDTRGALAAYSDRR